MLIRGRVRRFRAAFAARLLAICTLAVALIPASAEPALAFQPCPTTGDPEKHIDHWETKWPTVPQHEAGGVTLCAGVELNGEPRMAYVQIVDLEDGAKIRLHSDRTPGQPVPQSHADWQFNKRRAWQWESWLFQQDQVPDSSSVFSETNASFFIDASSPTTKLSLPEKSTAFGRSLGAAIHGWFDPDPDPAWNAQKRYLAIGAPDTETQQNIGIGSFPTHYTSLDVEHAFDGWYDGLVAFEPLYLVPGSETEARRTMLGYDGSNVYILSTLQPYTLAEAQDILRQFGSLTEIQLDGGGSAQLNAIGGGFNSFVNRPVPDVLAVYFSEDLT